MAVSEINRALGSWSLTLRNAPQTVIDLLEANLFGHIAIDAARDNPAILGDNLLRAARYVGPLRGLEFEAGTAQLSGCGMAFWLGDEDKKGSVLESAVNLLGVSFTAAITALLPSNGDVVAGSIGGISGSYRGNHRWESPREAIDYVVDTMGADWIVRGDCTLDAGPTNVLFPTTDNPTAAVIRRAVGTDMSLRALPGQAKLARDVEDFSTRVVTLAQGQGASVQVGSADIAPGLNTYKNLFGNPVKLTRMVSESNTSLTNANARAQLQLNRFTGTRDALTLSTTTHDIRGDVAAGDSVWCYDPDAGLLDVNQQIVFRGQLIQPVKLRVYSLSWPVTQGMGVYFRTGAGVWTDLSDYVVFETGQVQITVGGYDRSLTNSNSEPVGSRVVADTSVPAAPTLNLPWTTSVYQSASGFSRARIVAAWFQPANTDGSPIVDGQQYDVQVKQTAASDWTTQAVGFDQVQASIQELLPATSYDVRVRACDTASPPNFGAWSTVNTVVTAGDTIAPATPAAPTVAGNPVAIQVKHTLGLAAGGTYNLDPDLHHLEVHVSTAGAGFTPDVQPYPTGTQLGKMTATQGMMNASVAALATFSTDSTSLLYIKVVAVDESGNRSAASAAATATASLISDQYVSDLTATKITAGNLSAAYAVTGLLISGNASAARFEAGTRGSLQGGRTYRPSGTLALQLDALTGDLVTYQTNGTTKTLQVQASTGNVYLYASNGTTPVLTLTASTGLIDMAGKLTAGSGVGVGPTVVVDPAPVIKMYPSSALSRYEIKSVTTTTPGGTTGPVLDISAFGTGTAHNGPSITAWDDGVWLLGNQTGSAFSGGYITLYKATFGATLGVNLGGAGNSYVKVYDTGDIDLKSVGDISLQPSGTVDATVPFGTLGSGFKFHAQNGSSSGYRTYSDGSYLRFVENASNAYLIDNKSTTDPYKCFVIDHPDDDPDDPKRWLVHACIEAPEAQVEYRAVATIVDGRADVALPAYFTSATVPGTATVHLTMLLPDEPLTLAVPGPQAPIPMVPFAPAPDGAAFTVPERDLLHPAAASVPVNGRFRIASPAPDGTRVAWLVKATRADGDPLVVEPLRTAVEVGGIGPYRFTK